MNDRVGHVYYWSLPDTFLLVVERDDRNPDVVLWRCVSLDGSVTPGWFGDGEMNVLMSRFA